MPDYKQLLRKKGLFGKTKLRSGKEKQGILKFRNIPKKAVVVLVIIILVISVFFTARHLLTNFSAFAITKVSVFNAKGESIEPAGHIFELSGTHNLFSFNMKEVAADIEASYPEFSKVFLRKQFPDKLIIVVKEREPVALVVTGSPCLVDSQGFVLPLKKTGQRLPKIVGINPKHMEIYSVSKSLRLKKALKLLVQLEDAGIFPEYKVDKIDIRRYSDLVFYFDNGIEVKMGEGVFKKKAFLLAKILDNLKMKSTIPEYVDMRFDSPAVMP